jgi:predicted RNase H-like nuclease
MTTSVKSTEPATDQALAVAPPRSSFCAHLPWHCWRWGEERKQMCGTISEGYIVVPKGPGVAP